MNELSLMLGNLAGSLIWLAWRERHGDNARDAKPLPGLGNLAGMGAVPDCTEAAGICGS